MLRINRGGEVTHHCPGQLIGYPLLDLRRHRQDLRWYITSLEDVLINVLEKFGIQGKRHPKHTGVWSGAAKLAAIGINCSNWYTMHGFALNVNPDLSGFSKIVPCGITDPGLDVGSMHYLVPHITVDTVRKVLIQEFQNVFNVNCVVEEDPKSPVWSEIISAVELSQA